MYRNRLAAFLVLFILAFLILTARLACMQIFYQDYYEEIVERKRRSVQIYSGPRGTIRDRHGSVLATDKQVFDASFILPALDPLVFVKPTVCQITGLSEAEFDRRLESAKLTEAGSQDKTQILIPEISSKAANRLKYLIKKYPEKYGALSVIETSNENQTGYGLKANIEKLCRKETTLNLASELLGISYSESISKVDSIKRDVLNITNSYQRRYELNLPYILAKNITREQVEKIEVQYRKYPGILVTTRTQRIYPQEDLACHVLGYLRQLNEKEYNLLKSILGHVGYDKEEAKIFTSMYNKLINGDR